VRGRGFIAALALLAACGGEGPSPVGLPSGGGKSAMRLFQGGPVAPALRPNAEMVQDYLDLAFRLESGREVPVMTRFEGPITLSLAGPVPPTAPRDLAQLLARLRAEAGIDIAQVPAGGRITVEFLPRRTMQAVVPQAACFVVPNVGSWSEYRRARRSDRVDWARIERRDSAAVFIPADIAPQEIRDCLHEELAQALGPLNDLYRLPDSVFNDDNFQGVLTGFDMLMLRVHYAPELANGLTAGAAAAAVPGILARLNPAGGGGYAPPDETPRAWIDAIERALSRGSDPARHAAAARAVAIAEAQGWSDGRAGFAYFSLGRLTLADNLDAGAAALDRAAAIYAARGMATALAHVDLYRAGLALRAGRPDAALAHADMAIPAAEASQNAALLSSLLAMKAAALDLLGDKAAAERLRLDSAAWAGYGFGAGAGERMRDIAELAPDVSRRWGTEE